MPHDDEEAAHLASILALVAGASDPFSRDHWTPGHVTCSAFVLHPTTPALALIEHAKLGRWLQPGGHSEVGDRDTGAGARREVEEETGLSGLLELLGRPFDVDVHVIPARKGDPAHEHHDVRWLFRADPEAGDGLQALDGVLAAQWVPLGEVERWETDASVLRAVRKLVAMGLG